jgi:hypothetical protein
MGGLGKHKPDPGDQEGQPYGNEHDAEQDWCAIGWISNQTVDQEAQDLEKNKVPVMAMFRRLA